MPLEASFSCASGELVALVGPSGSGKTSLLRAIAGLLPAQHLSGHIRVAGRSWFDSASGVCLAPQQRRVGLVFQNYALFPHLNAIQNIAIKRHQTLAPGQLEQILERLGLAGLAQRRPSELSGGQQQRVALARALVRLLPESSIDQSPGVLLLDEPFSAVDAPTRQTLYRELAALRQRLAVPMVLVTHDLHEARRLADRVVILDGGVSLQSGTPAQVFASPRNASVAALVGIQNHFAGRFEKQGGGWGLLHWESALGAVALRVVDKDRIADGAAVTWVVAGEWIELAVDGDAPIGDNALRCTLREALSLGEMSWCVFEPSALPGERIALNVASSTVRAMALAAGSAVRLTLAPHGIHIMPSRPQ